jgi:hypothetical protein
MKSLKKAKNITKGLTLRGYSLEEIVGYLNHEIPENFYIAGGHIWMGTTNRDSKLIF